MLHNSVVFAAKSHWAVFIRCRKCAVKKSVVYTQGMGSTKLPNGRCIELNSNADKRVFEILKEKIALLAVPILDIHYGFHTDEDTD